MYKRNLKCKVGVNVIQMEGMNYISSFLLTPKGPPVLSRFNLRERIHDPVSVIVSELPFRINLWVFE